LQVLAVTLVALRVWWGWLADRRLERALAPIRAAGEPITPEDLTAMSPPVPDADNAAYYFQQAIAAMSMAAEAPAASNLTYAPYPPFPAAWHRMADAAMAANPRAFTNSRKARTFRRVDWRKTYTSPLIQVLLPELNQSRHLANLLGDAALHAHLNGDDAEALELVRDVRHLAYAVDEEPLVVPHLVAIGIDALSLNRLGVIACDIEIEGHPTTRRVSTQPTTMRTLRRASEAQVKAIIGELLDDRDLHAGLRRAMLGERVQQLDIGRVVTRGSTLLRPMFTLDQLHVLRNAQVGIDTAAAADDWNKVSALLAASGVSPMPVQTKSLQPRSDMRLTIALSEMSRSTISRVLLQHNRIRMERRLAAVALAVRLYRADHGDRWPASLDQLTPRNLPSVPIDPFDPALMPLRYAVIKGGKPDGSDRPIVYSVSDDGVDNTAAGSAKPFNWPLYDWTYDPTLSPGDAPDQWRDLSRWDNPPPPSRAAWETSDDDGLTDMLPSTQALSDDGDEPHAPRKNDQREGGGQDAEHHDGELGEVHPHPAPGRDH
jgi:hypothetical protein